MSDARPAQVAEPINKCGCCGFTAPVSVYLKHDCYWVWRERFGAPKWQTDPVPRNGREPHE